jgi:hypothetical protein
MPPRRPEPLTKAIIYGVENSLENLSNWTGKKLPNRWGVFLSAGHMISVKDY